MAVTPKGVRMINDNVVQQGLGLVINDRDVMDWNHIPNGSLYINPETGVMMMKIAGETDWVPAGIKNDGTLVISRDTSMHVEVFKIISINNSAKTFVYEDADGKRQTKTKDSKGFVFQIKGSYMPGRNHLTVMFDDVLERSAASGGIEELDEKRFRVTEDIPVGTEVTARYIQWVRIGNPYPRWYEAKAEPADAEVGDFFLDLDEDVESLGSLVPTAPTGSTGDIAWSRIIGRPTTLSGYGIKDKVSIQGHKHVASDITDLDSIVSSQATTAANNALTSFQNRLTGGSLKVAKATQADKATTATTATTATKATTADKATTATTATTASNANKLQNLTADTAKTGGASAANKIAVYDANGKIPAAALPKIESFVKGMIIDWYGASNKVPTGWHICDGTNGTPDLRNKFVIGAGGSYSLSATGGTTTQSVSIALKNIPPHRHDRGDMNITGTFIQAAHGSPVATGAFYMTGKWAGSCAHKSDSREICGFDASRNWTGMTSNPYYWNGTKWVKQTYQDEKLGDPVKVNILPPYVALFKIMYIGA